MKQCPACQRTYTDPGLTFCLDDGSTLVQVGSGTYDAPPTMQMPQPRVTDQPQPPFAQPPYQQPPPSYSQPQPLYQPTPQAAQPPPYSQPAAAAAGMGFKLNNRILGIVGSALVIVSVIMPLVSLMGFLGFSYLQIGQMLGGAFFTAYLIPLLGGVGLYLSLKNQFKPLIGIGVAVIAIVVIDYFRIKSTAAGLASGLPGAPRGAGAGDAMAGQYIASMLQLSMGFFALVAGAVLLIVAGAMKDKTAGDSTDWRSTPPPMNYR